MALEGIGRYPCLVRPTPQKLPSSYAGEFFVGGLLFGNPISHHQKNAKQHD